MNALQNLINEIQMSLRDLEEKRDSLDELIKELKKKGLDEVVSHLQKASDLLTQYIQEDTEHLEELKR